MTDWRYRGRTACDVDQAAVERQWLELWNRETDEAFRRELAGMTRIFADLSEQRARWHQALEGLGMIKSPFMESVRQEGRVELLHDLLSEKFGPLAPKTAERLQAMSQEQLRALARALLHANTLSDLGLE